LKYSRVLGHQITRLAQQAAYGGVVGGVAMKFFTPKNIFFSGIVMCSLIIWYYILKLQELVDSTNIPVSLKTSTFPCLKSTWHLLYHLLSLARVEEIGTNWNQWCLIFQFVPRFFKTRSFTSVFTFVPSWYALICTVKFPISNKTNAFHE